MKDSLHRFDQSVTRWVASAFGPAYRPFFESMTALGDPIAVGLVSVTIFIFGLVGSNMNLMAAGVIIPVTVLIGALLKLSFERARPLTEYAMNMKLQTFSFPSGHSNGSTITYGILALIAFAHSTAGWTVMLGVVASVVPLFVGLSRVYLGAHFPSDVIAGWALGCIALGFTVTFLQPLI